MNIVDEYLRNWNKMKDDARPQIIKKRGFSLVYPSAF